MKRLRNLGRFSITRKLMEDNPELVKKIMGECIITEAWFNWDLNGVDYIAVSLLFDFVPIGEIVPKYKIVFQKKDSKIEWSFCPVLEKSIDGLVDDVIVGTLCQCPKGSLCEFFKLDGDDDEICRYGII